MSSPDYMAQLDLVFGLTDEEYNYRMALPATGEDRREVFDDYLRGRKLNELMRSTPEPHEITNESVQKYWTQCM